MLRFGAWRSPVAHHFGVVGVAGSNPVAPTDYKELISTFTLKTLS